MPKRSREEVEQATFESHNMARRLDGMPQLKKRSPDFQNMNDCSTPSEPARAQKHRKKEEKRGFDFSEVDKTAMVVAYCVAREACSHVPAEVMLRSDFRILLDPKSEREVAWARRIEKIWDLRTEHPAVRKEEASGRVANILQKMAGEKISFIQMMVLKQIHDNITPAQFDLQKLDRRLRPIWYVLYWFLRSPDVFDWFMAAENFLLATAAHRCGKEMKELRSEDVKDIVLETFLESYDVDLGRKSVNTREQDTTTANYQYRNVRNLRYAQVPAFACHLECVEAMLAFCFGDSPIRPELLTDMEKMREKTSDRKARPDLERLFLLIEDTAGELMCVNSFASKNSAEMLLAVDSNCRQQILECWRDLDFARGGSNTYELFTDGKKNDKLLTDAIKKCREDIEGCLGMLCKRGALRYLSGSSCESDAITLPAETVKNIETILRGLRPIQLVACKGAGVLKDVKRCQITKPRRKKADNAVVFATPVQKIREWGLPDHIRDFLEPSRFQPRAFGDFSVRKKGKRAQVAAQVAKARQSVKTDATQLALSLPQEAPAIVDANAAALPIRVQEIHVSHQPLLVGGVVGCRRCHSIVGKQKIVRTPLARECTGIARVTDDSRRRFNRVKLGRCPYQCKEKWPDGLTGEVRRVVELIALDGQWRLGEVFDEKLRGEVATSARNAAAAGA